MSGKRTDLAELPPTLLALADTLHTGFAATTNRFLTSAEKSGASEDIILSLCLDTIVKSTALLGMQTHHHLNGTPMSKDLWLSICAHAFEHIERIETGPANDR